MDAGGGKQNLLRPSSEQADPDADYVVEASCQTASKTRCMLISGQANGVSSPVLLV